MCGIVGYIGDRQAVPVLVESLRRLEYRGYDSAGLAFLNGNGIEVYKTKGRIDDLECILPGLCPGVKAGIGHTRWATHGVPSSKNAHPHRAGGLAVVHNGIIENYRELKAFLSSEMHEFLSETDTEVIPQLIHWHMNQGLSFRDSITETVRRLRGSYALGIISEEEPGALFAVRSGSPIVVGMGDGECFFASDIPAILPYTRKFVFLEDGQMCRLGTDGPELAMFSERQAARAKYNVIEVDWTPAMAEKEGYSHFMHKEMHEQPAGVMNTLREWIDSPERLMDSLGLTMKDVISLKRLHIVACGTSFHAALVGRYMIESLAHIPVDIEIASEYRYREHLAENNVLFVSITQSGETADTLAAQREAKHRGARTLTICNALGSTAAREADSVLYTRAGPEIGVASTKAFTAQLAALALVSVMLGTKRGRLTTAETSTLNMQLKRLPSLIETALLLDGPVRELAGRISGWKDFLYLGRGINYPVALEGALKLKEISYIHAEGYAAGEMKHGPIALVEEGLPVVCLAPADSLFEKTVSNIEEVKARGARVIAIVDEKVKDMGRKVDDLIQVPSTLPVLSPFVNVIPLQLLAYHIAVGKGCDVDKPRNLAKSVTVE